MTAPLIAYPEPEAVARAILAAADATGEDPARAFTAGLTPRFAYVAMAALKEVFPHLPPDCCARMAAVQSPTAVQGLINARQKLWWREAGEAGFEAARRILAEARIAAAADDEPAPPEAAPDPLTPPPAPSCAGRPFAMTMGGGKTLADRILQALKTGAHTTAGLASRLGVKESLVIADLALLRHAGHVQADPQGEDLGPRTQLWRPAPPINPEA